ncbi:MAG: DnaJ domain-containing protein [Bacteroidetes bacterium]|jgi:DnaJ like chaperone protein|nr:DnaJ domain-containing protein [Bacteroidota bacterium]MBT3749525.1 DnaJ domain-containing protein [Bacteroidota bacterium]MBT4398541.1 DnaJ domain-containing protein [Bacteroidota bacterium]MBT4411927.1 DnaJ domain-containing protein [Bacteroidota bacterium]MBT7093483.1 DnaJ domain-containing protein [Bacteroidota bacterium]
MAKFGKWIGGGLGWAFLGPLGGLLGFALGSMLDGGSSVVGADGQRKAGPTTQGDFLNSLVVLVAAVMKADGKILRSELDYVKANFQRSFGPAAAQQATQLLKEVLKQDIPVESISRQIGRHMDYSSKLQLLHFVFGISKADGHVSESELKLIERISYYMDISSSDYNSVKATFYDNLDSAYAILEVNENSTEDELKKAYRKMAIKHHPDKVAYLGDDIKKKAKEKFQKLTEAYEKIKKARGIA